MKFLTDILGKVGFEWQVALANFVNFAIIAFVLYKFFWSKLRAIISKRNNMIEKGIEDAKLSKEELAKAEVEKQKIILEAERSADGIIKGARVKEIEGLAKAQEKAIRESDAILKKAEVEITQKEQKMRKEVEAGAIENLISGLKVFIGEKSDVKMDKEFLSKIVANQKR